MTNEPQQLHALARMISRSQLGGGFLALDWNENTSNYVLHVSILGDKRDLLDVVDRLRCELDVMYAQVKSDILDVMLGDGTK